MKPFLQSFTKCVDYVEKISSLAAGWLIVFLMFLSTLDVAFRMIARKSIEGAYTLSEIVMVGICFLAMAYTQKEKGHVSMDFIVVRLKGRALLYSEIISSAISLIICALLFYRATIEAIVAVDLRLVTSGIMQWPAWPLKIVVAFGFLLLSLRVSMQLIQEINLFVSKRSNDVA